MKIRLTADTRVLLSAGTLVDVSKETAEVIKKLGRCEIVSEKAAEKKAEEPEIQSEGEKEAEEPKSKKKGSGKSKE